MRVFDSNCATSVPWKDGKNVLLVLLNIFIYIFKWVKKTPTSPAVILFILGKISYFIFFRPVPVGVIFFTRSNLNAMLNNKKTIGKP
jgi:hypothetical protein